MVHQSTKAHSICPRDVPAHQATCQHERRQEISGDTGAGITKIVLCFGNAKQASSKRNLHILAIYEGDDSAENLRRVLECYEEKWEALKQMSLPNPLSSIKSNSADSQVKQVWPIELFLFGDLKFICNVMGHAGSSATSPCIFCHVSRHEFRNPEKGCFEKEHRSRTLAEWDSILQASYKGAMKEASVKAKPIIPIDIDHIIPPTLHLMLGIGTKIANEIQEACHRRDLGLALNQSVQTEYKKSCAEAATAKARNNEAATELAHTRRITKLLATAVAREARVRRQSTRKENECHATVCFAAKSNHGKEPAEAQCHKCLQRNHLACCLVINVKRQEIVSKAKAEWICPTCQGKHKTKAEVLHAAQAMCTQLEKATEALQEKHQQTEAKVHEFNAIKAPTLKHSHPH